MSDYHVIILAEQALTGVDAGQVRGLHEELEDVRYHVLIPVHDAPGQVEAAMGSMATGEVMVGPWAMLTEEELREARAAALSECRGDIAQSVEQLRETGASAEGDAVVTDPIEALVEKVAAVGADEVIIYTRPHLVAEFFHRDWTSRARKKLGVPVLHLIEHETIEAQAAGPGEGISGF